MGQIAALHQLQEYPDPVVILEYFLTSDDVRGVQVVDQAALINDTLALRITLTRVFEHDFSAITYAHAFEDCGKATFADGF